MLSTTHALSTEPRQPRALSGPTSASRLSEGLLVDSVAAGTIRRLGAKEHLFTDGDHQTHVYMVEAGTILLYKILPEGKRQVIDIAFPGDLIGLGSAGEHAYNAQATEPARVRCLAVGLLHQMACRDPSLGLRLYEAMARKLDAAHQHLLTISNRDASARVASFLLALAKRNERHGQGATELVLPMRRADIGDFLGLTIETVSRTFSKLKAEGVIDVDHGGYVEILDQSSLETIAEGQGGHA